MSVDSLKHTARLPCGYRATFSYSTTTGMSVAWSPSTPKITAPRAWRRFKASYDEARRTFMTDVATTVGGLVMIVDVDGKSEIVKPGTKH